FLVHDRLGYQMYRYIDDRRLKMVLQLYDGSPGLFPAAGFEGHGSEDFAPWSQIPSDPAEFAAFLRSHDVRYFIYRPAAPMPDRALFDAIRPHQAEWAMAMIQYLLPRSHWIFTDAFGWELRALDGSPTP